MNTRIFIRTYCEYLLTGITLVIRCNDNRVFILPLFSVQIYSKVKKATKKRASSKKGQKSQNEAIASDDKDLNPENMTVINNSHARF